MDSPPDSHDADTVRELVALCIEAIEHGETDSVARVCASSKHLEGRVRERLAQLEAFGLLTAGQGDVSPKRIGAYTIVGRLGSGGMGVVYHGRQDAPIRRDVAVKVIRANIDDSEAVARFLAERQSLALMDHTNIAKLHDAGVTETGSPYFVMELVRGVPLTEWCSSQRASVEERITLFIEVCRAVQHAHERGVIHRDLKPSNILVIEQDGRAVPKVIDFGVAKAVHSGAQESGEALHTRAGQVLGTLEYMSPEQAISGGIDVDTRTDVYSLGVVLFELLCGELPLTSDRVRGISAAKLEQLLLHEEAPSLERLAAEHGRPSVTREHDWICRKAMDKDRARRYASPLELAEDLERVLRHEPIEAGPESLSYRVQKFVRRHRALVVTASVILFFLVGSLVTSLAFWWQSTVARDSERVAYVETEEFYGLARDAMFQLVKVANTTLPDVPRAEPARRKMLEDVLQFYDALKDRRPRDPSLRLDVASAQIEAGKLLRELGRVDEADASFALGLAMLDELSGDQEIESRMWWTRAGAFAARARVLEQSGNLEGARSALIEASKACATCRAVRERDAAGRDAPSTQDTDLSILEAQIRNNRVVLEDPPPRIAIQELREVVDILARCANAATSSRKGELALLIVRARTTIADKLIMLGDCDEARTILLRARTELGPKDGDLSGDRRIALVRIDSLLLRASSRTTIDAETMAIGKEGVEAARAEVADHPDLVSPRLMLADILRQYSSALLDNGDEIEGRSAIREEIDVRRAARRTPPDPVEEAQYLGTQLNLARCLFDAGQESWPEAEAVARKCIADAAVLGETSSCDDIELVRATALTTLGTLCGKSSRIDEARGQFEQAATRLDALVARNPQIGRFSFHAAYAKHNHGWFLLHEQRPAEALPYLHTSVDDARRALTAAAPDGSAGPFLGNAFKTLGQALLMTGKTHDVARLAREVAEAHPHVPAVQAAAAMMLELCARNPMQLDRPEALDESETADALYDASRYLARALPRGENTSRRDIVQRVVTLRDEALKAGAKPKIPIQDDPAFANVPGTVEASSTNGK
ncbi:MAG: serine/threonine protein kinase [Planctomycetes bacterium]|nr:serine/threonine protein kinase [Planctomycetota bacterium]